MQTRLKFYNRTLKNFGKVNQDVMRDPDVSINAKAVYSLLCTYLGEKTYCYPSTSKLAAELNKSISTVNRALKELNDNGIINRVGTPPGMSSNTYVTDVNYQQQWKKSA